MEDYTKVIADLEFMLGRPLLDYQRKFICAVLDGNITNIRVARNSNKIPILDACKRLGKRADYVIIDEVESDYAP